MELKEALELIKTNIEAPEVKEFTAQFNPLASLTKDNVGEFVEKNDLLKSYRDSFHTKGLETWKANNLKKLVDEEVAKVNPRETPEQKKIRELEERLNQEANARKRESLRNQAIKQATEKSLPIALVDFLVGDDEEVTTKNLGLLESVLQKDREGVTQKVLKDNGRKVMPADVEPQNLDALIEKALKEGNNREYVKLMQKKYEKKE